MTAGLTPDGERCFIRVDDTGVGIPQNKISEIFERFFQSENSKNTYFPGTGIGLALSKEIVNLHHGTIQAENKPDQGTVFTIELLLGKDHFDSTEVNFYVGDKITEIQGKTVDEVDYDENVDSATTDKKDLPTLLVVEDNKDLCNLLRLQLDDKYKVYTAGDGVEGLKKVYLYHPDIVVTDQMMPEMTGTEMLEKMRDSYNFV